MENKLHPTAVEIYFIERVKQLRTEKGFSQAHLHHQLDVSAGFIGNVEISKDRAKYNLNMLIKLKQILECEYEDLLP